MITALFYFNLSEKKFAKKVFFNYVINWWNAVEAEALRVEVEAIQKLPVPHLCLKH